MTDNDQKQHGKRFRNFAAQTLSLDPPKKHAKVLMQQLFPSPENRRL